MLLVSLNFLYIAFTTYLVGFAISEISNKWLKYQVKHTISILIAGLIGITVYVQIYSLFAGVSFYAHLPVLLCCCIIGIVLRKKIVCNLLKEIKCVKEHPIQCVVGILFVVLIVFGTSRGYFHWDTGLYHAQSIRWIEEYGVVEGLANLHSRFAYNSSAFAASAFYSMGFLFGQPMHALAGFLVLISGRMVFRLTEIFIDKKIKVSHFMEIGILYYISFIYIDMISPASDFFVQLIILDTLLLWILLWEEENECKVNKNTMGYALLAMSLCFMVTVKFSMFPFLLFSILPIARFVKEKRYKLIMMFVCVGILIVMPFLLRNIVISGWLLYPSTLINIGEFDWKIPIEQVQFDSKEICAYARGFESVEGYFEPMNKWIPGWFAQLKVIEKAFVLLNIFSIMGSLFVGIWLYIRKEIVENSMVLFMLFISVIGVGFWFATAPLVRYGYAYLIILPVIFWGYLYQITKEKIKWLSLLVCIGMMICVIWCGRVIKSKVILLIDQPYYVKQQDYVDGDASITYNIGGTIIYVPDYFGQIGYNKFPSSPKIQEIEMRGENLESGFRYIN